MKTYIRTTTDAQRANIRLIQGKFYTPEYFYSYPYRNKGWLKETPIWIKQDNDEYIVFMLPQDFFSDTEMIEFLSSFIRH